MKFTAWAVLLSLVCGSRLDAQEDPRSNKYDQYRLDPLPARLAEMKGVHPRLFLTEQRVRELRKAVDTTHADVWNLKQGCRFRLLRWPTVSPSEPSCLDPSPPQECDLYVLNEVVLDLMFVQI